MCLAPSSVRSVRWGAVSVLPCNGRIDARRCAQNEHSHLRGPCWKPLAVPCGRARRALPYPMVFKSSEVLSRSGVLVESLAVGRPQCGTPAIAEAMLVPGAWCLVPGARCLVPGAWCPVPGAWRPAPSQCPVPGVQRPAPSQCPVPVAVPVRAQWCRYETLPVGLPFLARLRRVDMDHLADVHPQHLEGPSFLPPRRHQFLARARRARRRIGGCGHGYRLARLARAARERAARVRACAGRPRAPA